MKRFENLVANNSSLSRVQLLCARANVKAAEKALNESYPLLPAPFSPPHRDSDRELGDYRDAAGSLGGAISPCGPGGGAGGGGSSSSSSGCSSSAARARGGASSQARPRTQRLPSLRLANGRVAASSAATGSEEEVRSPRSATLRDDIKISVETTTCTDSLVTAGDDETAFVSPEMNFSGRVHFGGDDASLYGTPKEEMAPAQVGGGSLGASSPVTEPKPSFLKNQLQALFQPTDNKLAMKLFGSKKALMKERIRQKAAGHWIIHPCSNFR